MAVNIFSVRHLSPGAAFHLQKFLDEIQPEAVLIEGPSDANEWIPHFVSPKTKPPVALLAYTQELPVHTILYPFAEYSPEYIAALWGTKHKSRTEFIDLPCSIFIALEREPLAEKPMKEKPDLYEQWAQLSGYEDYETYWEAEFEHNLNYQAYQKAIFEFGKSMRILDIPGRENLIRESFMRRRIAEVIAAGIPPEKIAVITGAYHTAALNTEVTETEQQPSLPVMSDAEYLALPSVPVSITLMPYSNLRLSSRTGYGAGNSSPRYFKLMWDAMRGELLHSEKSNDPSKSLETLAHQFFTETARYMRNEGTFRSTAEVIEAVRLAQGLASLKNQSMPTLKDLRSAAITCLGQGEVSVVSKAMAAVEVGTEIGALEEGVSRTAIQDDFYRQLQELKLNPYKSAAAQELELDLRENRSAKTEKSQWLDLHRSYFLHRIHALGISFAKPVPIRQESATWKELWILQWTPEAEIEIVESSLKGESLELAASYSMKESLDESKTVSEISSVLEQASCCGIPSLFALAVSAIQAFAADSDSFADIAAALGTISSTIQYGDIRRMETASLFPLLSQLFLHGTLIAADNAHCNQKTARELFHSFHIFNKVSLDHYETLDEAPWIGVLREIAERDDLAPPLSGYGCAILLERNMISEAELEVIVLRRLSPGIEADIGAGWFEGLAARNHYGLLSRSAVWKLLNTYIETLDSEEFIKALVFLRRTFADFSVQEKRIICDNLGDLWNLSGAAIENKLSAEYSEDEKAVLNELSDFSFDDF